MRNKHAIQEPKQRLTKEELLKKIEERLTDPNISARELASLSKRWANLTGAIRQGEYVRSSAPKEPEPEPPFEFNERRVQFSLFWELVDMVGQPEFDGVVEANPDPKTAIGKAMNALWLTLSDNVKTQLQTLAVECAQRSRIAPLSGTETIRFCERAHRIFNNLPEPIPCIRAEQEKSERVRLLEQLNKHGTAAEQPSQASATVNLPKADIPIVSVPKPPSVQQMDDFYKFNATLPDPTKQPEPELEATDGFFGQDIL